MNVCPNCFDDKEIKSFISNQKTIGTCSVCSSENQHLIDIDELKDFFQELLNNFELSSSGSALFDKINTNWDFFKTEAYANKILDYVLQNVDTEIKSITANVDFTAEILENIANWDTFKDDLKWKNRFISYHNNLVELGWDGFFNVFYEITSDMKFYRARLHTKTGLSKYKRKEMYSPPKEIAPAGRANPSGIPYLYLSDNEKTVLYEIRATLFDEVSIGVFKLNNGIKVHRLVDFTEGASLFDLSIPNLKNTITSKLLCDKISLDLSKPMRRYDSELEYVPTQFICEFIKNIVGADGIIFRSSVDPEGKNIVIFNQEIMKCIDVSKVKINTINLKYSKVN